MQEFLENTFKELEVMRQNSKRRQVYGSQLVREMDRETQVLQEITFEVFKKLAKITDILDKKIDRMDQRYPIRLEEKVIRKDLKGIDIGSTGI
jgi:hypothetical protein|tara:strand:+ start:377 stop:655 length:279 start_codon:yes stop_codon:yes gene_type:complete